MLSIRLVYVYADGRVISWRSSIDAASWQFRQFEERRLTPEGVELVRSGTLRPEEHDEAAPDVWDDPTPRPYVPSRYSVCAWTDDYVPSRVLRFLPSEAQADWRGGTVVFMAGAECTEVTTDEARELVDILGSIRTYGTS